jgi:hypothetical protein
VPWRGPEESLCPRPGCTNAPMAPFDPGGSIGRAGARRWSPSARRTSCPPPPAVVAALARSKVSRRINTSFLERQNATDRHHNMRKVRKTYTFSKAWRVHEAMTYFKMYSYNFCWHV